MFKPTLLLLTALAAPLAATAAEDITPQDLADKWTHAYNTHNASTLAELYDENAIMMLHESLTLRGRHAIRDYWANDFREGNPITTLTVTHVVEGIDMMLVHGNYQVIDSSDGVLLGQGSYAHIWLIDGNGNWLLDRDLWSQPFEPDVE